MGSGSSRHPHDSDAVIKSSVIRFYGSILSKTELQCVEPYWVILDGTQNPWVF